MHGHLDNWRLSALCSAATVLRQGASAASTPCRQVPVAARHGQPGTHPHRSWLNHMGAREPGGCGPAPLFNSLPNPHPTRHTSKSTHTSMHTSMHTSRRHSPPYPHPPHPTPLSAHTWPYAPPECAPWLRPGQRSPVAAPLAPPRSASSAWSLAGGGQEGPGEGGSGGAAPAGCSPFDREEHAACPQAQPKPAAGPSNGAQDGPERATQQGS